MWIITTDRPSSNRTSILPAGRGGCEDAIGAQRRVFSKGSVLFASGDPVRYVYKIVRGAVRTSTLLPDARRQVHSFLFMEELLGLERNRKHSYTADAIQETVVDVFRQSDFHKLLETSPTLAEELVVVLMAGLERARDQMLMLARRDSREKVAIFLLELADRLKTDRLQLVMPRADIADYLGVTRETVSRTMASLARDGLICLKSAGRVVLCDKAGLSRILWLER